MFKRKCYINILLYYYMIKVMKFDIKDAIIFINYHDY